MIGAAVHALLYMSPALALWLLLALGRYPGEAVLARRRAARRGVLVAAALRAAISMIVRAPRPLAWGLAGRAPPRRIAVA